MEKSSTKDLKRFFFTIMVDSKFHLSGSFVCEQNQMQKQMMDMTVEYSKKFTEQQNITFAVTYIAEERKIRELVYSDGEEDGHVDVFANGGFIYSIMKIMENKNNLIIGINQEKD